MDPTGYGSNWIWIQLDMDPTGYRSNWIWIQLDMDPTGYEFCEAFSKLV